MNEENTVTSPVERLVMLFDGTNPVIEVFHESPDNTFISAVVGAMTIAHLERIEHWVSDILERGDGIYSIRCEYNSAIFIADGLSEGEYWELEVINYESLEA